MAALRRLSLILALAMGSVAVLGVSTLVLAETSPSGDGR